jgi:hypothetical protein
MIVSKQMTEAVQFGTNQPSRKQFGVGSNLPPIAFSTPEKGWTISSKLGELRRGFDTPKRGDKRCTKTGDTICEEAIKSPNTPRENTDFVEACHAGRCEFESRPSRRTGVTANFSF